MGVAVDDIMMTERPKTMAMTARDQIDSTAGEILTDADWADAYNH